MVPKAEKPLESQRWAGLGPQGLCCPFCDAWGWFTVVLADSTVTPLHETVTFCISVSETATRSIGDGATDEACRPYKHLLLRPTQAAGNTHSRHTENTALTIRILGELQNKSRYDPFPRKA